MAYRNNKKWVFFLLHILFAQVFFVRAQEYTKSNFGIKIGIMANFGSHLNQFGVKLDTYVNYKFLQINCGNTSSFSFSDLARRKNKFENRFAIGAIVLGGKKTLNPDFIWDGLRHQSSYENALGYNYLWYRDNTGTSQNSGGWTIQFTNFQLFFENDIFAGSGRDKFRTGNLMLCYRYKDFNFQLGTRLWTGETRGSEWRKVYLDKCPSGFRILEDLPYGKTSHGLLYGGLAFKINQSNSISGQIGFDSEQVRHIFQNRISHDMVLFPKNIKRKTPHYPRLDEFGCPVFISKDKRKDILYLQFGINPTWSY